MNKLKISTSVPNPKFQDLILLLFFLHVLIVFPIFFPNLRDIGAFDNAVYINSGRLLIDEQKLPLPAWNPLGALLYRLIYIPLKNTTFWIVHCCTIGRFMLFPLLWMGTYLVAKELSSLPNSLITMSLVVISPVIPNLLPNPSDALYTALSAFTLWQVLLFFKDKAIKHLWFSSIFTGLAALTRVDGIRIMLFIIFFMLSFLLSISLKKGLLTITSILTPFGIILGGYSGLYSLYTGRLEFGLVSRSYLAFEQGQGFAYGKSPQEGQIEARQLYGTPEKNQNSILIAISNNPEAFKKRLTKIAKRLPFQIYKLYGKEFGILTLLLAGIGVLHLIRKRCFMLLLILFSWILPLGIYFLTFFRDEYLLFPLCIIFPLASLGIFSIFDNSKKQYWLELFCIIFFLLAIWAWQCHRVIVFTHSCIFFLGLILIRMVMNQCQTGRIMKPTGIILFLLFSFFLRPPYPEARFRKLGVLPEEKAILYIKTHLKEGSRLLSYTPLPAFAAKMKHDPIWFQMRLVSETDLRNAIATNIDAVYVDHTFRSNEPLIWKKVNKMIGKILEVGYSSPDNDIQVLLVKKGKSSSKKYHTDKNSS